MQLGLVLLVNLELIGISAGILTSLSLLPQLIKIMREKQADELSIVWLLILFTGLGLWTWYGWLKDDLPLLISNAVSMLITFTLMMLKYKYRMK